MAWLQNLAGKAENLLNKIDQNAATVLNDPNIKQQISVRMEEEKLAEVLETSTNEAVDATDEPDTVSIASDKSDKSLQEPPNIFERTYKSDHSVCSINNSEDLQKFETRILELEKQNQQLASQVLNLQHLYSEVKNENVVLNEQLQRANESVALTNAEMEQYKIRAQRVLQEKEKLITYTNQIGSDDAETDKTILTNYLEEIKKELSFQQEKNEELNIKLQNVSLELSSMQQQFFETNRIHQETIHNLEEALAKERKLFSEAEEEIKIKNQEMQSLLLQLANNTQILKIKDNELEQMKVQLRQNKTHVNNSDVEARIHSLTQTLMSKQSNLETLTTERNALRLQLEKLENEYHKQMTKIQQTTVKIETVNDTDDAKLQVVPQFMRVSPMDAGVTKRVKRAYSTLDAISVRTGVFLRRYPLARVFVFSYCVLLHFWVIIILFTYVPSVR